MVNIFKTIYLLLFIFYSNFFGRFANCHDLKGFDDTILFQINWPGNNEQILVKKYKNINLIRI